MLEKQVEDINLKIRKFNRHVPHSYFQRGLLTIKNIEAKYEGTLLKDICELKDDLMKLTIDDENRVNGWQDIALPDFIKLRANSPFFKEYVHSQSSKANGLNSIIKMMNIKREEIIAIGDYYNDLDMFEFAGLSIAMANAPDDVKQKADDVTCTNDEDGVCFALAKQLKS